jgi:hypothetical protein
LAKPKKATIDVQGSLVAVSLGSSGSYISLTDIARSKNPERSDDLVRGWLRNRNTIEFLGTWEQLHNPNFNSVEFDGIRMDAGLNTFTLTPKQWIARTGAIGIVSQAGRYGGTHAHQDIAFEFASWVSVEFKLYLIKEFQRLVENERERLSLEWNLNRSLSKINYRIHTDAIKSNLIPAEISDREASFTYANEADLLNMALFGKTARQWRSENSERDGNIRDHASVGQLLVLANLESLNAELILMGVEAPERLKRLNETARRQMQSLVKASASLKSLSP